MQLQPVPTNRLTMRRIRETLRLHLQAGLSYNEVGRALKISKSAVGKYVSLARVAGVDWVVAQTLIDDELEARLYRPPLPRSSYQLTPDFAAVHQELKRPGVTLQLQWEESPLRQHQSKRADAEQPTGRRAMLRVTGNFDWPRAVSPTNSWYCCSCPVARSGLCTNPRDLPSQAAHWPSPA